MAGFQDRSGRFGWQKMEFILLQHVPGLTIERKLMSHRAKSAASGWIVPTTIRIRGEIVAHAGTRERAVKSAYRRLEPDGGFIVTVSGDNYEAYAQQERMTGQEYIERARARKEAEKRKRLDAGW